MMNKRSLLTFALVLGFALPLAGCGIGAGDVQFEGKVFEAMGLNKVGGKGADPKLKERAPILMPPSGELPPPGTKVARQEDMQWPTDPDLLAKKKKAERQKEIDEYCAGPGKNEDHPFYNEEKANECGGIFSKMLNGSFGRAEEPQSPQ